MNDYKEWVICNDLEACRLRHGITMRTNSAVLVLILINTPLIRADTPEKDKWEPSPALKELKARCVGPAAGGRVCRVTGIAGDPLTYYAATAGGGVWKSTDGGLSFGSI